MSHSVTLAQLPWSDGVVDVQDLIVPAEHLFEEFAPATPGEWVVCERERARDIAKGLVACESYQLFSISHRSLNPFTVFTIFVKTYC